MLKKISAIALLVASIIAAAVFYTAPEILDYTDTTRTSKTLTIGEKHAVVTGTPWATQAAMDVLGNGGSACDAAIAALLVINVTHGEAAAFGGVTPTLYYNAQTRRVRSYIGVGTAPAAASIEAFSAAGLQTVPSLDIRAQLIPAAPDVIAALLQECGKKSFAELAKPAIELARNGFPMHAIMHRNMDLPWYQRLGMRILMPSTAEVWLPHGWWQPVRLHQKMTFPDLANTLQNLADAETRALQQGHSRQQAIQAMRDYFYRGPIAEQIAQFHRQHDGFIRRQDLQQYQGGWESPVSARIGRYTFFANGTWSQGILAPQVLQILQTLPLKNLKHNSAEYIHSVTQAIELAMSDRDTYVADPGFVAVPTDLLLSPEYALARQAQMTPKAFDGPARAGEIPGFGGKRQGREQHSSGSWKMLQTLSHFNAGQDTSQISVIDSQGNAVVITPSDFPKSPMLPGTGINLGDRITQFQLDPQHINALQPGKRPRITPHALMVYQDERFLLAFSTPGGDMQAQALVQVFLNLQLFGMDIQQAISAPRFYSINSPSSFAPHESTPAGLRLEQSLYADQAQALSALGYQVQQDPEWDKDFGAVGGILKSADGKLLAGADPREETTAAAR